MLYARYLKRVAQFALLLTRCLQPSWTFTRSFSQVPVTALAFTPSSQAGAAPILLSGQDTDLKVYSTAPSSKLLCTVPVFTSQSIHGIHVHEGRILVWGGTDIALLACPSGLESLESQNDGGNGRRKSLPLVTGKAPDWVYEGAISPSDRNLLVFITAHNEVLPVHYHPPSSSSSGCLSVGRVISPSRPILFSGTFRFLPGGNPDKVLVVGGTAFGEILVWICNLATRGVRLLHALSGHEGSIFGVDVLQLPAEYATDGGLELNEPGLTLLASCSDDRTVRIWDITESGGGKEADGREARFVERVRETGFGSNSSADPEGQKDAKKPITIAMGHASRIWGVKICPPLPDSGRKRFLDVYSFGEDAMVQRWKLDLVGTHNEKGSPQSSLASVKGTGLHDGKHLWSNAIIRLDAEDLIAIGGADGKINIIRERPATTTCSSLSMTRIEEQVMILPADQLSTLDMPSIVSSMAAPYQPAAKETINRYDFISRHELLATTSAGRVLLAKFADEACTWCEVTCDPSVQDDLPSCYVMKSVGSGAAVMGTSSGKLYTYTRDKGLQYATTLAGKIVEIFCLTSRHVSQEDTSPIVVLAYLYGTSGGRLLQLDRATGQVNSNDETTGMDPRFRATSASKIKGLLFIGSRHGWLSVLQSSNVGYSQIAEFKTPSRDAITAIVPLPSKHDASQSSPYLLATTRDGKYRVYELHGIVESGAMALTLRHETSLPFGPMIEGAWFTDEQVPELILYGFKSGQFIVWSESRRKELVSISCGGAHRIFSLARHLKNPECIRFACTRASKLSLYHQARVSQYSVQTGTHGREIRAVSCTGRYVATGAEDTSIRIWIVEHNQGGHNNSRVRYLASDKVHITGIQKLKWLGDTYLLSSAGNEEFFVWRVCTIESAYETLGMVCEGVFTHKSPMGDLRIMDFDACEEEGGADGLIVSMAFSSSAIKTFRYAKSDGFRLLAEGTYTGACPTQLRHVKIGRQEIHVLTASTDGHVVLWKSKRTGSKPSVMTIYQVLPLHQSTIKSLDLKPISCGFQVMTGGDDNAIGTAVIEDQGHGFRICRRGILRGAHAAAINGVALASVDDRMIGASISNDQRLKLWRLFTGSSNKICLLQDVYSGVADAGDVDFADEGRSLVVGGIGLEVWTAAVS